MKSEKYLLNFQDSDGTIKPRITSILRDRFGKPTERPHTQSSVIREALAIGLAELEKSVRLEDKQKAGKLRK